MTTVDQHVARAKHNQRFAESFVLDTTEFRDWVVTGYFYSALHLVDAYLIMHDKKADDGHASRNTRRSPGGTESYIPTAEMFVTT